MNDILRALLGTGMAGGAADDLTLRPQYDRAVIDGEVDPKVLPYEAWKKLQLPPAPQPEMLK